MVFMRFGGLFRARHDTRMHWDCLELIMILQYQGKFSKFFGPSPRKLWLTVYRGLQVQQVLRPPPAETLVDGSPWAAIVKDSMIRGRLTRILEPFRAQGSALTRNVSSSHGSKNLLQRVILNRHERILLGREDCKPGRKKTICKKTIGFFIDFSGCINSFGLALCVTSVIERFTSPTPSTGKNI